jgi:protein-disulfide isomerase
MNSCHAVTVLEVTPGTHAESTSRQRAAAEKLKLLRRPASLARHMALTAAILLAAACSTSAQQQKMIGPNDTAASVGSVTLTLDQIDRKALAESAAAFGNLKLLDAIYEARRAAAEEMVGDILISQEAKRRNLDESILYQQEVTAKATAASEQDVSAWYEANAQRLQGATLDDLRPRIQSMLNDQRTRTAREAYVQTLKAKTPVKIMIPPPRVMVSAGSSPVKGSASAPIELIEFADFECPYCLQASPTVKKVLDAYGDRIRFVYRNFPLQNHPHARPAAEAAQCANEQGQFWAYHDRLFGDPGKLSDGELKQTAAALGLNADQFNKCVDDHKFAKVVETDAEAGADAGVTGTPAFFINGRPLSGAQPFEAFKRVIDEELELRK